MTIEVTGRADTAAVREAQALKAVVSPTSRRWRIVYPGTLVGIDLASLALAGLLASQFQFHGDLSPTNRGGWYALVLLVTPVVWVALLATTGNYRLGRIGLGADEYKGVFNSDRK